jgi:hypothetical protein
MAITIRGKKVKARRGKRMTHGKGWRLMKMRGEQVFIGTLLGTMNFGSKRIAIFSVPKTLG